MHPEHPPLPGAIGSRPFDGDPRSNVYVSDSASGLAQERLFSIPGYTIERELGRGGSATVYLAREHKHDRRVAIKVLHPALSASLQAQRFLREIEILSRLTHPHILPLLDSAVVGDVLFYVMPYVSGESLRVRLDREHTLPVEDAVRIAREVAAALDYAHRQGFVHRDIKPENILLVDGHAVVADFGIGRAINAAIDHQLTTGTAIGTPPYMSPEQVGGKREIDGRSDIYSLGCVLYELISGAPPFTGTDAQAIILQHLADPAPPLRLSTPTVPRHLDWAISMTLEKSPACRFDTAGAFAEALVDKRPWRTRGRTTVRRVAAAMRSRALRYRLATGGATVFVLLAIVSNDTMRHRLETLSVDLGLRGTPVDTTLYVIVPSDSSLATSLDVTGALQAGLQRWRDITVGDAHQVIDVFRRSSHLSPDERAPRTALLLHAGRYIRSAVERDRDSATVTASLFETRQARLIARASVRVAVRGDSAGLEIQRLADSLLFPEKVFARRALSDAATTSVRARRAYQRGHLALANGEFARADSEFAMATRDDDNFAQALLWLTMVRNWTASPNWAQSVMRAEDRRAGLGAREGEQLEALAAMSARDYGRACALWRRIAAADPNDYASWYSLGNCLHRDQTVIRESPSRSWHFRSSMNESVLAFVHAFQDQPSLLHAFAGPAIGRLRTLLFTSSAFVLTGVAAAPDTLRFTAYPVWQGDSLAYVPLLHEQSGLVPLPESVGEAVQHQRYRFREVATLWSSEFPASGEAVEALAIAMEMLGDETAVETITRARRLAASDDDRLRMGVTEVWLRVKFGIPSAPRELEAASKLADSILWLHPVAAHEENVGSLAALTGRAARAAAYARMDVADDSLPSIAHTGPALLAFAALGGPADTLRVLERTVDAGIASLPASARSAARRDWVTRAATLAYPDYRFGGVDARDTGLRLGNLVVASIAHDTARMRSILATIATARRALRPSDIMPDGLLPEATALAQLGDYTHAIERLDPTLNALRSIASQDLAFDSQAGSLVRAMVLRADLARAVADTATARLWANAVLQLWSGADPFLQPVVQRMQQLAR